MIIQAAARFTCVHRYIATATADADRWLFVCDNCALRTELLPLERSALFGQLLTFPSASIGVEHGEAAAGRYPQPAVVQSA